MNAQKTVLIAIISLLISIHGFSQVSGNINYQQQTRYSDQNINIPTPREPSLYLSVKALANVKADSYVAIFSLTQTGKTTKEVNTLLDERLADVTNKLSSKPNLKIYVDMVSFVPVYDYDVQKKLFSKNTYNEIPKGFELKKNIHIKYTDPNELNKIIPILADAEIYDLVRVDYFSNELESIKNQLRVKAKTLMQEKLKNNQELLGEDLAGTKRYINDGYKVVYPVEQYQSYQAYSSSSLNLKKNAKVNTAEKTTSLYYQPIINKEFDIVLNPGIFEPVIQVMYEVKLMVKREDDKKRDAKNTQKPEKQYLFVTPNGDIKKLAIE